MSETGLDSFMKAALLAAFPHELKHILKNVEISGVLRKQAFTLYSARYSSSEILIVQTGMGERNAQGALEYVLDRHRPDAVLSVGFGGALYPGASIGELVWAGRFLFLTQDGRAIHDLELPCRQKPFRPQGMREGCIITLEKRMKKSDLGERLPEGLPFPVCDMESFPQAKLAAAKGLPFCAVRSITDRADEEIPSDFFKVTGETGGYRLSRALGILLRNPGLIPHSVRLGRNSGKAAKMLWLAARSFLKMHGEKR